VGYICKIGNKEVVVSTLKDVCPCDETVMLVSTDTSIVMIHLLLSRDLLFYKILGK
jgi:hypothetical protein